MKLFASSRRTCSSIVFNVKGLKLKLSLGHSAKSNTLGLIVLLALAPLVSYSQQQPTAGPIPPYSTLEVHEYDTINLATLAIQLNVPVRKKAGHIPFSYSLMGASQMNKTTSIHPDGGQEVFFFATPALGGFESHFGGRAQSTTSETALCGGGNQSGYGAWIYSDATGSAHPTDNVGFLWGLSACGAATSGAYTTDGSGLYVDVSVNSDLNYTIDLNGNKASYTPTGVNPTSMAFTDPNGNAISAAIVNSGNTSTATYTDTLGATALTSTRTSGTNLAETDSWTDAQGHNQSVNYYTTPLTLATTFGCSWNSEPTVTWNFPSSVSFPDGSSLSFGWEKNYAAASEYTGRLTSITLPSGGQITYAYTGGTNGVDCNTGMPVTVTRTTPDGKWTYTSTDGTTTTTTTVTDPQGNNTVYNFTYAPIHELVFDPGTPLQTEKQVYNGGTLIQTVITCYNSPSSTPTTCNSSFALPITEKDEYTGYPGVTGYSAVKTTYDTYGRITDVKRFDYNATSPTTEQQITYGSGNPTTKTCTGISTYILGKPCSVSVLDSKNGNAIAQQTWYAYDSNGNQTESWKLVSGSTYITTAASYNANGTTSTTTDARQAVTTLHYDGSCNGMFPTSTTKPTVNGVTQNTYQTWDCNGGVLTSSTDPNGNKTTYDYINPSTGNADPWWRLSQTTYPDGGSVATTYSTGASHPWSISTNTAISSGVTSTKTSIYDGLGRISETQLNSDPGGVDYVDTTYDKLGRVYSISNPYRTKSDATYGLTTYGYDALSRKTSKAQPDGNGTQTWSYNGNIVTFADESGNQWQRTYDGLGRLTTEKSPNGSSSSPSLETDYTFDANNNMSGAVERGDGSGNRNRSFFHDDLSRLIASNNPENASAANPASLTCPGASGKWTACYGYDANGNLTSKTDNRNITISYSYDALNRLTSKHYSDGTPSDGFGYDGNDENGNPISGLTPPLTNPIGGLSHSSNEYNAASTYSYDKMGRITKKSSCVPGDCSYDMNVQATYNLVGQLSTLTNGISNPGVQFTYEYDGADRLKTLSSTWDDATHPVTLFSASATDSYGPVGLQNALLGVNTSNEQTATLARGYDKRSRLISETDSTTGTQTEPATKSVGSISVSLNEQSKQVQTAGATPSAVSITFTGTESTAETCTLVPPGRLNCTTKDDTTAIVLYLNNTVIASLPAQTFSTSSIAGALASQVNANSSLVSAATNGSILVLTSKATGPGTNYSYSVSISNLPSVDFATGNDTANTFAASPVQGSLAGGNNAQFTTVYDSGTISASINGQTTLSISWGNGSSASGLASALASAIQSQDSSFLNASASGSTITLSSTGTGSSTNWPISISVTHDSGDFSSSSLSASSSGLSGGMNPTIKPVTAYSYSIPSSGGFTPNGNLISVDDSVMGQWQFQSPGYDTLDRLVNANATSGPYQGQYGCWAYDAFDNRLSEAVSTTACASSPTPDSWAHYNTNNQISSTGLMTAGYTYDAAGNISNDGVNQYLYDGEGRVCAVESLTTHTMTQYVYDPEGHRVAKGTISTFSCHITSNGFTATNAYVVGLNGEQLTEADGAGHWLHTNIFTNGMLLATYGADDTFFAFNDWLGTKRAEVGAGGCLTTYVSLPFGNSLTATGSCPDATEHHFTGKERDGESTLDYFGARYYNSAMGRFISPDPSSAKGNKYAYANNNPLMNVDRTGLLTISSNGLDLPDQFGGETGSQDDSDPSESHPADSTQIGASFDSNGVFQDPDMADFPDGAGIFGSSAAQQQNASSGGHGFWSHVGNLLHGHSWNYGMRESVTHRMLPESASEPNESVTAATDTVGMVGLAASEKVARVLGPANAIISVSNDPSSLNITTNVLGFVDGFEGPMAFTGAFNDFLTYGINNSNPGPHKAYDSDQLQPTLPRQDSGCEASGLGPC